MTSAFNWELQSETYQIEIVVNPIHQFDEKFVCIMLVVTLKGFVKSSHNRLFNNKICV